jgi:hypothetical protein
VRHRLESGGEELISDQDYERLCYVRKSGDYPAEGTEAWAEWDALTRRFERAYPSWPRERIAWHEAGHILAGHRLGGQVVKITPRHAHIDNTSYPDVPYDVEATVIVAGHVAQEMKFGRVDPSRNEASRIAWRFRKERARDPGETVTWQECRAYVEAAEARARAIFEDHWDALEAIAQLALQSLEVNRDALLIALAGVPNGDPPS